MTGQQNGLDVSAFGAVLDTYRATYALSQSGLSELLGCDHSYVSRIIAGNRQPSRVFVENAARTFGLIGQDADAMLLSAGYAPLAPRSMNPRLVALQNCIDDKRVPVDLREAVLLTVEGLVASLEGVARGAP